MAGAALVFKVPDDGVKRMLQLVAKNGGLEAELRIDVADVADVEFTDTSSGLALVGANTAARFIAGLSPGAERLLGATPEQQAQVAEWLTFGRTELSPLVDDKLVKLNDWLLARTLLAGNEVTLADLLVYAAVQPAVCGFPVAQHQHFCNLLRWYDYVHHVADLTVLFPVATFARYRFVLPPPPAAPQPKPAAAAASAAPAAANSTDPAAAPAAAAAKLSGTDKKAAKKAAKKAGKGGPDGAAAAPDTPATSAAPAAAPAASSSSTQAPAAPDAGLTPDILDLRVGVILKVGPHPNADSLYVEEIDVGEEAPRQIVSGLRKFVPEAEMQGRHVVVVCNLKPAKMRDVVSYGMVLCASNAEHTEVSPVAPPTGALPGERVRFEGFGAEPEAQLNPRKKQFEKLAPDLVTDAAGVCTFKGTVPFMCACGPVTASLPNAHIS